MSANQPSEIANGKRFSPPRLRLGSGSINSPFALPSSDRAPSMAAHNGEQIQDFTHGQVPFTAQDTKLAQASFPSSPSNFFGTRGVTANPHMSSPPLATPANEIQSIPPTKPSQFGRFTTRTLGNESTSNNASQFGRFTTRTLGNVSTSNDASQFGHFTTRTLGNVSTSNDASQFDRFNTGTLDSDPIDTAGEQYSMALVPANNPTGALTPQMGEYSGNTGMLKLNQAVKVVKIPIPGRPGEFKTGILPVISQMPSGTLPPPSSGRVLGEGMRRHGKILILVAMICIVLIGTVSFFLLHASGGTTSMANINPGTSTHDQVGATSTALVKATATAAANASILVDDPLSANAHNWLTGMHNGISYSFTNGAYHIRQNGTNFGYAIMYSEELPKNYTYSLTMQNIMYDTANSNALSFYGLIMNYHSYSDTKASFYLFRVNNGANISYEFDKFDNRTTGDNESPWQEIFPDKNNTAGMGKGNGKEFLGPHQSNSYSVTDLNGQFTFLVNGKQIGTLKDTSFTGGGLGMGVSQAGSEAAFTNLILRGN